MSDSEDIPPLRIEDLTRAFAGAGTVLRQVSCELSPGRATAVIGPNGAGKTTLIRLASGLLEPTRGRILLDGEPLDSWSRPEIARRVSVLRQAPPQVFGFSALEMVLMGFHARSGRFALPSRPQHDRALEAMERLEIAHLAERPATALSGGELQRTLMARTMVAETDVWLLDEPTAHLDPRHQMALLEQMRRHVADGRTALCVLHDLGLVHRFFDEVLVLKAGAIRARGPVDETLDRELLSEVFEVEIERGAVGEHTVWLPA